MRAAQLGVILPLVLLVGAGAPKAGLDPINPTCPKLLNWSDNPKMQFRIQDLGDGEQALIGEGVIDLGMANRLADMLRRNPNVHELWLRSPGGNAKTGNAAGLLIRKSDRDILTRIPAGWACFSACNFVFMGGRTRIVEPGGQFIVHMFTHVGDREGVKADIRRNADAAVDMIGDIEQDSALLASDDNDFLIRMGVSRKLLTDIMYKQKAVTSGGTGSTRRCLTQRELRDYQVTNATPA
ncbi:MAG: hypothetical protein RL367_19 [Pseudomonadota bacterium]